MIFLLLVIAALLIFLLLMIFFRLRIYILLNWQFDDDQKFVQLSATVLHLSLFQKKIDFASWEMPMLEKETENETEKEKWQEKYDAMKSILQAAKMERITSKTFVATDDPIITAFLYTFLKDIAEWISSTYNDKQAKLMVAADFEESSFQSVGGECMISTKLSKTMKEIRKIK
ncbi:hypothetical protein [Gracilibacillus boraciitolerans]|nr:hypothetical protein [Gracilibacillus boraciitolerans]